jgi:predicted permease
MMRDFQYALRVMAREKTFSAAVILTLGLCIGANAAIFTIVNAVLLRPLPYPESQRLVWVANSYPRAGVAEADNSVPDYFDRREGVPAFEDVALYSHVGRTVGTTGGAERMRGLELTPSLFGILRARAFRGRLFTEEDAVAGQHHKVVLSYALWQQQFGGRDGAIGEELRVNGVPHVVIGIMPREFVWVDPETRLYLPLAFGPEDRADDRRHSNNYLMVARLKPGASIAQAQRQIHAIGIAQLERTPIKQMLLDAGYTTVVMPLQDRVVQDVRGTLYLLWGGVAFVLLIGAVNVTNLTLVRATARAREFATRQALGAGRWELTRQLLAESLLLTTIAGVVGLLVASAIVRTMAAGAQDRIPRASEIGVDAATVLFTIGVTVIVGALVALLPLVHATRLSPAQAVREEGRSGTAGRGTRLARRALVTAQVGFAFMLLIGAGLLLASFREILTIDPGFQAEGVLTGRISLPPTTYQKDDEIISFAERLLQRAAALPGVSAVGLGTAAPFTDSYSDSVIFAEGYVMPPGESVLSPARNVVTPGYFEALQIPVRRGRVIDRRDTPTSQRVIVIDEKLAAKFWPGQDPVGKRMFQPNSVEEAGRPGPNTRWLTVIGVVGEVRQRGLVSQTERFGAYYFPLTQSPSRNLTMVARTSADPLALAPGMRREVAALNPELPFYNVLTLRDRVEESVAGRRTAMMLAVGFGGIALMLATIGIYGVLAYQVTQRTREIGIRMALGSDARRVFALVLGEGAALLALGFLAGLGGAFAMRRAVQGELYGVDAMEPSVVGAVAAVLALVALAACALPARRAARIDPVIALSE